jgi:hypothetical protein
MLTKLAALAHSKVALAIIGAALVGGTGTAAALAATSGHLPLTHAITQDKGTPEAKETPKADSDHAHSVSVEGVLKAYNAGGKTISVQAKDAKSPTTIAVDANTKVNGEQASSLGDLAKNIGHDVQVQADKQSNGSLLAWKITLQGADNGSDNNSGDDNDGRGATTQQHFANGAIASVGSNSFVVTGIDGKQVTVTVNSATKYEGAIHSLSDLQKGMRVLVVGTQQSNGSLLATAVLAGGLPDR